MDIPYIPDLRAYTLYTVYRVYIHIYLSHGKHYYPSHTLGYVLQVADYRVMLAHPTFFRRSARYYGPPDHVELSSSD